MKKILITILFCFSMLPVFADTKTVMSRCMQSWKGYSINEVISVWGYPTSEKELAGKHLYYWEDSQQYLYTTSYGIYGGTATCIRILEVDDNNFVVSWEYKGNSFPSSYKKVKKWVNPQNDPWQIEKEEKQRIKQMKKEEKELIKNYKKDQNKS